mgnify:CR=1 FL=1
MYASYRRLIKDKTPVEKQAYREEHATPLLEEYKAWLDKSIQQVPPKSALGKALAYSLNQWPKLIRYLEDGELNIDKKSCRKSDQTLCYWTKKLVILKYGKGCPRQQYSLQHWRNR